MLPRDLLTRRIHQLIVESFGESLGLLNSLQYLSLQNGYDLRFSRTNMGNGDEVTTRTLITIENESLKCSMDTTDDRVLELNYDLAGGKHNQTLRRLLNDRLYPEFFDCLNRFSRHSSPDYDFRLERLERELENRGFGNRLLSADHNCQLPLMIKLDYDGRGKQGVLSLGKEDGQLRMELRPPVGMCLAYGDRIGDFINDHDDLVKIANGFVFFAKKPSNRFVYKCDSVSFERRGMRLAKMGSVSVEWSVESVEKAIEFVRRRIMFECLMNNLVKVAASYGRLPSHRKLFRFRIECDFENASICVIDSRSEQLRFDSDGRIGGFNSDSDAVRCEKALRSHRFVALIVAEWFLRRSGKIRGSKDGVDKRKRPVIRINLKGKLDHEFGGFGIKSRADALREGGQLLSFE